MPKSLNLMHKSHNNVIPLHGDKEVSNKVKKKLAGKSLIKHEEQFLFSVYSCFFCINDLSTERLWTYYNRDNLVMKRFRLVIWGVLFSKLCYALGWLCRRVALSLLYFGLSLFLPTYDSLKARHNILIRQFCHTLSLIVSQTEKKVSQR